MSDTMSECMSDRMSEPGWDFCQIEYQNECQISRQKIAWWGSLEVKSLSFLHVSIEISTFSFLLKP